LEDEDVRGRVALRRPHCPVRLRRCRQRPKLHGLRRAGSRADAEPRATSSRSTISAATMASSSATPYARQAPSCSSCRPTARTSTRSNRFSPSSNVSCARRPSATSTTHGNASDRRSADSKTTNAEGASPMPAMLQSDAIMLENPAPDFHHKLRNPLIFDWTRERPNLREVTRRGCERAAREGYAEPNRSH